MKVMVVDDSAAMRMIVLRTLRKAGFRDHDYEEAVNGADALAKIKAGNHDFVLSDWNMPEMTGIDLLKALRAESNEVKFGFITTETTEEMKGIAKDAGALFIIGKPFNEDTFRDVLDDHLG
jgi:two-component system, chemotaxis family, chemotaxis protein CheY